MVTEGRWVILHGGHDSGVTEPCSISRFQAGPGRVRRRTRVASIVPAATMSSAATPGRTHHARGAASRLGVTIRRSTSPEVVKPHKNVDHRDENPDEGEKPTYLG